MLIFKDCKNDNYTFEKNEYILNLDTGLMTREFIYTEDSYKKLRLSDIKKKKELFDAYHEKNVSLTAEILTEHNYILKEGGLFGSNPDITVIADWAESTYGAGKVDHYNN